MGMNTLGCSLHTLLPILQSGLFLILNLLRSANLSQVQRIQTLFALGWGSHARPVFTWRSPGPFLVVRAA